MENNKELIDACFNKQHAVGAVGQTKIVNFPKLWSFYIIILDKNKNDMQYCDY